VPYRDPQDQKRAARRHYEANKEAMKARASVHRKKHRRAVQELTRASKRTPCADCKVSYPSYVMQFDHRAAAVKSCTIGAHSNSTMSLARMKEDIDKCDVVANAMLSGRISVVNASRFDSQGEVSTRAA
jgi:bisphosphoglycerate-dependent phosphoglycerate mutase